MKKTGRRTAGPARRFASLAAVTIVLLTVWAPAGAQTRTNFASSVTSESMTPMWVARDRGLFKKHGLEMQYVVIPRSPLAVAALLAGEIDAEHCSRQNLSYGAFGDDLFFLRHCAANIRASARRSRLAPPKERRSLVRRCLAIWRSSQI